MKASDNGFLYYEANNISQTITDRFKNSQFIKKISKHHDTFVLYTEVSTKTHVKEEFSNSSIAKITYANSKQPYAKELVVIGNSNISQEDATDNMFNKLQREDFENK